MFYFNEYVRAKSLDEAYQLCQNKKNVIAGGMLWLKMKKNKMNTVIDLCNLGLDKIEEDENEFRIGAYVSLRELELNESLNDYTKGAMKEALKHIVGVQFRNLATLGGSLWGRYGFSDVMTVFLALNAKVQLHNAGIMKLEDFVNMPRNIRDILVSIIVPKTASGIVYKSQRNQSTDFPVLTCSVAKHSEKYVAVIGATPYIAKTVWDNKGILNELNDDSIEKFTSFVAKNIKFGSNLRAGEEYRRIICGVLLKRALKELKLQDVAEMEASDGSKD